jgi:hypothetical protein
MSQSEIIQVLFKMGVTDDRSTSVTTKQIGKVIGEYPLPPSIRRGLYHLTETGEVVFWWGDELWKGNYCFGERLYRILKKQMSDKEVDLSYKVSDKTAEMSDKCPTNVRQKRQIVRQIGEKYARNRENIC